MFSGSMVAIITPMHSDGKIDYKNFADLVDWHLEQKTHALVVLGTTGEAPTINAKEREQLIKQAASQINGQIPLIVGTGTNCTQSSIELTRQAMELGADACLLTTPYYNKPPQAGLYLHYKTIAEEVPVPLIMYNVPSRTGCDMLPETVARLAKFSNIVGMKEATGKLERVNEILQLTDGAIDLYSGDDATCMAFMLNGGKGVISVTANVAPNLMSQLCVAALNGKTNEAQTIDHKLQPLHQELFVQANPIPVKWALHAMGKIPSGIRLPLISLEQPFEERVRMALAHADLM